MIRRLVADPLSRNAFALVGSNFASAGLGLVFWIAAARTYSTSNVGIDTALISAMGLLGNIAMLNLTSAFNRFVPTAGTGTRRLVGRGYLVTGALAVVASVVFVAGVQGGVWAPQLSVVVGSHTEQLWFVVATLIWTIFTLQDAVLAGLGEAPWVLVENVSYGILKLVVLLVVANNLPRTGVFVAWTAPLVVFVGAISLLLFGRLIPRRRNPPRELINARVIGRFVSADYPAQLMIAATVGLMPLLALTITGDNRASAYVYLSWTFAYTLHLVSTNVGMSMITEASRAPERLVEYARQTVTHALRIVVPLVVLLILAAPYVLRIEGADYATHATRLLQLFTLAAIPNVIISTYLNVMRVERRMSAVLVVTAIESIAILVPSVVMLHLWGIVGVGIAWLVTQSVIAFVLLCGELRTLWLPYLPSRSLRALADSAPFSRRRQPRSVRRLALETLESSGLAALGWSAHAEFVDNALDVVVLRVASATSGEQALLKVATSARGSDALHREVTTLETVRNAAPSRLDDILPRVIDADPTLDRAWMLEACSEGVDARSAVASPEALERLLADVTERMCSLYRFGMATLTVDDTVLARWVDEPLANDAIRSTHMRALPDAASLASIRASLYEELAGHEHVMSLTHGDLWLGNLRWDPEVAQVRGIVDWHRASVALPGVDIMRLICTTRALAERREVGAIVREILTDDRLRPAEAALLDSVPGADDISLRASVLLAWLRHVFDHTAVRQRLLARDLWLTHNVHVVLENLPPTYHPTVEPGR